MAHLTIQDRNKAEKACAVGESIIAAALNQFAEPNEWQQIQADPPPVGTTLRTCRNEFWWCLRDEDAHGTDADKTWPADHLPWSVGDFWTLGNWGDDLDRELYEALQFLRGFPTFSASDWVQQVIEPFERQRQKMREWFDRLRTKLEQPVAKKRRKRGPSTLIELTKKQLDVFYMAH